MSELYFLSFSSGSSGNCYYLGTKDRGILIDAGISIKRLRLGMEAYKLKLSNILAVLVTHEHMDHIRSLSSYCKKLHIPVYTSEYLHGVLASHFATRSEVPNYAKNLLSDMWTNISDFEVRYFIVPHDARQTIGFAIRFKDRLYVHLTDLGRVPEEAMYYCKQADTVVIESNYDVEMLLSGKYSNELKKRIIEDNGHLSNDACAAAIKEFYHKGLRNIFLCHISANNNSPSLAYNFALRTLETIGVKKGELRLEALPRKESTALIYL